jgi:hypothetical protein
VLERVVENHLVRQVKKRGGEVRKLAWIGRRHAPDRLVMWPGYSHLVELKRPGKRARAGQEREHDRLRAAGFSVFVLSTIEAVNTYIGLVDL